MNDPIRNPVPSEDIVHGDNGAQIANATSAKEARTEAVERQQMRERNEFATVLATEAGQSVIMRLLVQCDPYGQIHMAEHAQAALLEGRRRIGLWIINQMGKVDPALYPRLLISHLERQRKLAGLEAGIAAASPQAR